MHEQKYTVAAFTKKIYQERIHEQKYTVAPFTNKNIPWPHSGTEDICHTGIHAQNNREQNDCFPTGTGKD
jgi:hypothetical protein